jgi:catechol 2,3-dioxygenase-like lactoylglutathione lyase family enzyme
VAVSEPTFFGISHVDVPVTDLARARRFYSGALGFEVKAQGDGFLDVDAGTLKLRLVETRRAQNKVAIRVQSPTVEAALDFLVSRGARLLHAATRTPEQQLIGAVHDPDGNTLQVWRELLEDEYDFVPELPKQLVWQPEADALLKSLLKSVPALFRMLARHKVAAMSEELASTTRVVTREEVIRGFILASPKVTRNRNRKPLIDHGVDVERYREDWDAN